jgi:Ni/Co efflux regulator RcnB
MTISKTVMLAAATAASMNIGAFSQAFALESRTAPHASAHHKTDNHRSAPRHETRRAQDASTECWHNTDPDRGASRGFGYTGAGPC